MKLKDVAASLVKRGYEAVVAETREEAVAAVMRIAAEAKTVGWGGSESVKELGLREKLLEGGRRQVEAAHETDLYLLSANAITRDGIIVNIDGRGNRVAASIAGPKRVVYVIGRNKVVEGGVDAAMERIHEVACPLNCRRLGKNTPCARTGHCADCDSPDRICRVVAFFPRCPRNTPTLVVLVNDDLGY